MGIYNKNMGEYSNEKKFHNLSIFMTGPEKDGRGRYFLDVAVSNDLEALGSNVESLKTFLNSNTHDDENETGFLSSSVVKFIVQMAQYHRTVFPSQRPASQTGTVNAIYNE